MCEEDRTRAITHPNIEAILASMDQNWGDEWNVCQGFHGHLEKGVAAIASVFEK